MRSRLLDICIQGLGLELVILVFSTIILYAVEMGSRNLNSSDSC